MDVDTESAPLADPGSCLLQTCRDGLSAAPADASEIQRDGSKLEPVESDLHLRKAGEMAAGSKSWRDSQQAHLDSTPAAAAAWLHCVSNYLLVTGSAIGHLDRGWAAVLCSTVRSGWKSAFRRLTSRTLKSYQEWTLESSDPAVLPNLPQTSSAGSLSQERESVFQ